MKKTRKNIMDFSDIEHNALKILLRKMKKEYMKKQRLQKSMKKNFKK